MYKCEFITTIFSSVFDLSMIFGGVELNKKGSISVELLWMQSIQLGRQNSGAGIKSCEIPNCSSACGMIAAPQCFEVE